MEENTTYEFGAFRLTPAERQLLREGQPVPLKPKAFDTLVVLVHNSGHVVKKDDLIRQVWPDSFVEENNLNHYISLLRKTLSDGHNGDSYLETVRGYGFRFNADVRRVPPESSTVVVQRTRTQVVYKEEQTETQRTTTVTEAPRSVRRAYVTTALIVAVIAAAAGTYFGFIRPAQSRSSIASGSTPTIRKAGENQAAREAYLKGRHFWNQRNPDAIRKAQRSFQDALDIDPNYAPAYVGLADCLMMGGSVPGLQETSKSLDLKALAIDDSLGEAHASLAYYMSAVEWDWAGAEVE